MHPALRVPAQALPLCLLFLAACGGGAVATLRAEGRATGEGPAQMTISNASGVVVEGIHVARTDTVDRARSAGVEPGSEEDEALWGNDHLGRDSLREGKSVGPIALPEGRYDVLAVDHDKREQLVRGLRLKAGGRYSLSLVDSWAQAR